MKRCSVKVKITLLLTVLMVVLSVLMLLFTLLVSSSVVSQTAAENLTRTLKDSAALVRMENGALVLEEGFSFHENGVSFLIYNKGEALLAGQLPVSFSAGEPFRNGQIHTVPAGNTTYMVLDLWIPDGWDNGIWLRGLLETYDSAQTTQSLLIIAAIVMPVFIFLGGTLGYRIVRRAFQPLDSINTTVAAINEAKDLSRRIGLPPGSDEFSRLADSFDRLFGRLEDLFEAEKQFTADASHELRTPVSIIKGACEYSQKYDETPEERKETMEMIYRQSVRMSELIDQLLRMTRLEQGTEPVVMERLELGSLVRGFCEEQAYDAGRITLNIQEDVMMCGNASLLCRLVGNLADNAFKYSGTDAHVWISVFRLKEEALLQVRDNGIGIPKEAQEKIWQRFYQVDASRSEEVKGTGLGLAMVRQIAQLHDGYMTLESTPGKGSTFTLHLPAQNKEEESEKNF